MKKKLESKKSQLIYLLDQSLKIFQSSRIANQNWKRWSRMLSTFWRLLSTWWDQKNVNQLWKCHIIPNQGSSDIITRVVIRDSYWNIFRGLYYADFEIRKNPNDGAVEPVLTDIGSNVDFESFEASIPNFTNNLFDFLFCDDEASLPLIKL